MKCEICGREKARDVEHARMVTALCEREITPRLHGAKETCWRLGYEREKARADEAEARTTYWREAAQDAWRMRDSAVAVNEADLKDLAATQEALAAARREADAVSHTRGAMMGGACHGCGGPRNWSLNGHVQAFCWRCEEAFHGSRAALSAPAATPGEGEGYCATCNSIRGTHQSWCHHWPTAINNPDRVAAPAAGEEGKR